MATTLRTSGITMGTSTLDVGGSAPSYVSRAWANFNGATNPVSVRGSFNVSSITWLATGLYSVQFTTNMASNNYFVGWSASNAPSYPINYATGGGTSAANAVVVQSDSNTGGQYNNPFMFMTVVQ